MDFRWRLPAGAKYVRISQYLTRNQLIATPLPPQTSKMVVWAQLGAIYNILFKWCATKHTHEISNSAARTEPENSLTKRLL